MKGVLGKYFDAIFVISLDSREDRRKRLTEEFLKLGLADPAEITWIRAVSGAKCWAPGFFAAGAGAWGCLQSHQRVLQDAIMDYRECILVVEDDATFHSGSAKMLDLFFKQLPSDWDQVFLGGEHFDPPQMIKHRPFVLEGKRVHRTHAYALKREVLPVVYQHIVNYTDYMQEGQWHVDHQLGAAHHLGLWKTYTPSWWIVGQKGGDSNISERNNPDYWWHPEIHAPLLPMVWSAGGRSKKKAFKGLIHFGNNLLKGTLQDTGLEKCVNDDGELTEWMKLIATEAVCMGMLPGIHHPSIDYDRVASVWSGRTLRLDGLDPAELVGFPLINHLRHSRDVMGICGKRLVSAAGDGPVTRTPPAGKKYQE